MLEAQGIEIPAAPTCDIYIAGLGEKAQLKSFELVKTVRSSSLSAECDIVGRSLKAQMKYADKIGAKFSIVLGDSEIESGKAQLKIWKLVRKQKFLSEKTSSQISIMSIFNRSSL